MIRRLNSVCVCALPLALIAVVPVEVAGDVELTRSCSWVANDPGEDGVGTDPDGYWGAVFDGRYVYFVPNRTSEGNHGEVLRYDTNGFFFDTTSWETFDPGDHGIGNDPDGFNGGIFDGRYVYFVPFNNGTDYHGEVLRFDTNGAFENPASWAVFDPGDNGVGDDPDGYIGGAFDGRYVYFSPYHNGVSQHGEVLRLDTTGDFDNVSSWATYDAGENGVGEKYGYSDAVYDGQYVYFVPNCTSDTSHHGEVRRYDTTAEFDVASSWAAYDAGEHGVGVDPDGYLDAVFDGRYIYFVPYYDDTGQHGEVLRYDTAGDFEAAASWNTFDAGANGIGNDPDGYSGAVFDGRYLLFTPYHNGSSFHSEVLQFDTSGDFLDPAAWAAFDPDTIGVTNGYGGYTGGVFDGQYIYLAPLSFTNPHGEVLRFNTGSCLGDFDDSGVLDQDDVDQFSLCYTGPDGGPPGTGCVLGDFDSDDDVDCDDWLRFLQSWTAAGPPPSISQCACAPPNMPGLDPTAVTTNRYIPLSPGNAGQSTALRITFVDLPAPFDTLNGQSMWVSAPQEFCENSGQDIPPAEGCGPAPGLPSLIFLASTLQCEPFYADWSTFGTVHVYHEILVTGGSYDVQAIGELCDPANELTYSDPLEISMSRWGDICGSWNGTKWDPPDGSVDVTTDVTAILDKYKNLPGAVIKGRSDIEPGAPDQKINISDVLRALDAFRGEGYPFAVPSPPPPCP